MIRDISSRLSGKLIRLTPEVRDFCEAKKKAADGDQLKFSTLADGWIYCILNCVDFDEDLVCEWHPTDAFHWRTVAPDWKELLLLKALLKSDFDLLLEEDQARLVGVLQSMAHQGLMQLREREQCE
jgi:hypothetical protein